MKAFFFLIVLLSIVFNSYSQSRNIHPTSLRWVGFVGRYSITPEWTIHTRIDNRRFINPNKQNQFIAHLYIARKVFEQSELGLGITHSRQSPQNIHSTSTLVVPEWRVFQDFASEKQCCKLKILHKYRIEERFLRKNNGKELTDGYSFQMRFRYRIQLSYPLVKNPEKYWMLRVYDEVMINAGKGIVRNVFDQNRIFVGLEHKFATHWAAELGYMKLFQQQSSGVDFLARDIFRLSIIHIYPKNNLRG
ncbi:MAG: hypothetical protein OHK0038_26040 [Flammeovirgaceae bacterium]